MALAAVGLLVLALPAHAAEGAQGVKARDLRMTRIGGVAADSSEFILPFDASGRVKVVDDARDRDYSTPINLIGPVSTLGPGNTSTGTAAVALGEYTSLMVMVSWNTQAAADSDSVAFGLTFVGKVSTDANDGFDYLAGAIGDTAAFFVREDSTAQKWKNPTAFVISYKKPTAAGGATHFFLKPTNVIGPKPYYVNPAKVVLSDGRNGVCFVLSNPGGAPFKFKNLLVAVTNYAGTVTFNNVKIDVWPKVN